ncbi:MAG: TetR family transcriptional regulator [Flavobacterium sp. BFFFF2]|nr:MAG: TetR family transcriptional regulator [Flavobacterium sp. BFFFF2]
MAFTDKQLEIIQVAEALFAEKGFDGTSIRDISAKADVNVAMVSYYFGSKEKLLEALVLHRIADMSLQLENIVGLEASPKDKILKVTEVYLHKLAANCDMYKIVQQEMAHGKRQLNSDAFNEVRTANMDLIRKIVEEGQRQGAFQQNVKVELLPNLMVGSFMHLTTNRSYYQQIMQLTDDSFAQYLQVDFVKHIQQTLMGLLCHPPQNV